MWLTVFAAVTLTVASRCCTSQPTQSASGIVFKCSANEMKPLQRYWRWMQHETTPLEKVTLYKALIQKIAERQGEEKTGKAWSESYERQDTPIELTAYRMISFLGMFVNFYTSPDVHVSHVQHLLYTDYQSCAVVIEGVENICRAQYSVMATIMDMADDKVNWEECWIDVCGISKHVYDTYQFRASSDVTWPCGLARGRIHFTQPATPGSTFVEIELEAEPNRNYIVSINGKNTCEANAKNQKVDERNLTESIDRSDDKKLVRYKLESDQIDLRGSNNVIGNTVVIYEAESDLHDSPMFVVDTESEATVGKQVACGVIHQIY